VASFDKAVPPGGEGKITLTVNTKGYEGNINKTAEVYTNDPKMARFKLGIRAFVLVSISVSPPYVNLEGTADHEVSATVKIVAGLEKDLVIESDRFNLEDKVQYRIEEVEKGRSYLIHFTSIPGKPGIFKGSLDLKTNYKEKPLLDIQIRGSLTQKNIGQGK
jgi:hypothetical protein